MLASKDECLWEAPGHIGRWSLKSLYAELGVDVEGSDISQFFRRTLQIPDVQFHHIIEDLDYLASNPKPSPEVGTVRNLYRLLQEMAEADESITENLRYVTHQSPLSMCALEVDSI